MRVGLLAVLLLELTLAGCGGFVPTQKPESMDRAIVDAASKIAVVPPEIAVTMQSLGEVVGYSCRNMIWDPEATADTATYQLKLVAAQRGATAISFPTCVEEAVTLGKNCWQAFTCQAVALRSKAQSNSSPPAQQGVVVKPLAERQVETLPPEPLFWRVENFPNREQAQAAAGPWSLVAEADGHAWLFTLGAGGGASPGASKVAEVGPIPSVAAPKFLLRINEARGSPGSVTPVHTHPGSEAFYVLSGEQSIRTAGGVMRVAAGQAGAGHGADTPMQVSSSGSADLHALVMFVVDATRPFSSPAKLP